MQEWLSKRYGTPKLDPSERDFTLFPFTYMRTTLRVPNILSANLTSTGERDKQRVESLEWFCAIRHFIHYFR